MLTGPFSYFKIYRLKQDLRIVKPIFEIMTDRKEIFVNHWEARSEAYYMYFYSEMLLGSQRYRKRLQQRKGSETMSDLFDLLPRDKNDFERVNGLKNINKEDLIKLIPELMEWLQDINWPIALEISQLLLTVPEATIPFIRNVLASDDDLWKEWCLRYLVKEGSAELRETLKEDLERIAYRPTEREELEEVHITAQEILEQ